MDASQKRERLIEAATALLAQSPNRRMQTTNLNKALFYVDLACLRDLGETLTRNSYLALQEGPVIAKYPQRLVNELAAGGFAEQQASGLSKPIVLLNQPPTRHVEGETHELIKRVAKWCMAMKANQVSDFSHQNPGWKQAYEAGLGRRKQALAINLSLALQQIVDDDPWLEAPLDQEAQEILAAADRDEGEEW